MRGKGKRRPKQYIVRCTGQSYQITNTLLHAFQNIDCVTNSSWLWRDAISISQDNLDEKAEQVQDMYRVFAQATRVIAWLGVASEDSDLAMQGISDLWAMLEPWI